MERVLIVAKTHMKNGACVSGLTRDTNKGIRLLNPDGFNQPANTPFDVGQVWELEFLPLSNPEPPHVEDVIVTEQRYVGDSSNVRKALLQRVPIWKGDPKALFDGLLMFENTTSYISKSKGIPTCSTGYWLLDGDLTLTESYGKLYYITKRQVVSGNKLYWVTLSIPYVGYAKPIQVIPAGTLVRVSLARWWPKSGPVEERKCHLQLSGWYL